MRFIPVHLGPSGDSVCAPHTSNLRIKSFDSLNTQTRSSKVLQIQYRSLVSHNDGITTRAMMTHDTGLTSVVVSGLLAHRTCQMAAGVARCWSKRALPFSRPTRTSSPSPRVTSSPCPGRRMGAGGKAR